MTEILNARGFDFHCHVDLAGDPVALIDRCEEMRILTLAVTTTPKAWSQNRKWTSNHRFVIPALGLHPELVAERHPEVAMLESLLPETRFVGEIGLDASPQYQKGLSLQKEVCGRILGAADRLGGRVCTLHSRRAGAEVLDLIEKGTSKDRVLCILHWFTGTMAMVKRATELGCWFSVNGQMLARESGQKLVKSIPLNRLLTETDAPFSKEGDRASVPWDVSRTAERLAALHGLSVDKTNEMLRANATHVLAFGGIH